MKIDSFYSIVALNHFFVDEMRDDRKNIIVAKSFDFSVQIIEFSDLLNSHKRYSLSNQLFKSGTSVGANIKEAQNAESKQDFIHKMKIAAKEADETEYWLELCRKIGYNVDELILQVNEIQLILSKIISTSKKAI